MMGLADIERESRRAARSSAALHLMPLVVWTSEEVRHAPFLGTRVPKGWRVATYDDIGQEFKGRKGFYGTDNLGVMLFCDASGFSGDDEPALSGPQMHAAVDAILASNTAVTFGFGIYEVGQFQCHLRVFVRK